MYYTRLIGAEISFPDQQRRGQACLWVRHTPTKTSSSSFPTRDLGMHCYLHSQQDVLSRVPSEARGKAERVSSKSGLSCSFNFATKVASTQVGKLSLIIINTKQKPADLYIGTHDTELGSSVAMYIALRLRTTC